MERNKNVFNFLIEEGMHKQSLMYDYISTNLKC